DRCMYRGTLDGYDMSSGLGITERAVLNLVQEFGHLTVSGVRGAYPHIAPNSIRRAMRSLAAKGFAGLSETPVLLLASPLLDGFSSLPSGEKPERGDVPIEANMSKRSVVHEDPLPRQAPAPLPRQIPRHVPAPLPRQAPDLLPRQVPRQVPAPLPRKTPAPLPSQVPRQGPAPLPRKTPAPLPSQAPRQVPAPPPPL